MSAVTEGDMSPWATAIHQLVQWVGNGRTLTTTGQLRVADGLELVQLLGTGDDPHGGAGGQRRLSSSRNLPVLQGLLTGALEAGLLRTQRGRLIPVKKYAQQAATAEGVRRLLVANAHRSAQAALAPEAAPPDLGRVRLAALWAELARNRETPLVASELASMLWNTSAPGNGAIEQTQASGVRADERIEFDEVVSWVLLDYAHLGLVAMNADQTLVQLTPTGSREYDECLAPTAEASSS
ncbi:hypothetical protein K388_06714 [Streptomyces sp. KhCrAH-43]|uniref:hypothetical protein n=1 Tax=unclassified Streptomyces TaxID=2593676 RepID=UPI00036891BC|nr:MULTISPECIES: hypothetical protein [unclassified Streptomyces]MYS33396.1 hypothetical protein [Streptomyces sp. SID4920]MYX64046.1 hypothetical protein [Streptomyces sp. SID8373]RAJ49796.1 hypothetical protein K388_06714 [Streptomyces sp. KhCrAH-43]